MLYSRETSKSPFLGSFSGGRAGDLKIVFFTFFDLFCEFVVKLKSFRLILVINYGLWFKFIKINQKRSVLGPTKKGLKPGYLLGVPKTAIFGTFFETFC
jgi:hypothetical protein